ncbi:MAG: HAD-IIIA family hydrolase [Candidatus Omnitrophica bacterium]|jgi:3-deoxy-D-manno-octulosonate 8-phosphate phosphatase (KDO 8-P phosphatase)|nr:HAD-IIIA family hydrolase [Candidatus Omnitrophota bacterium]
MPIEESILNKIKKVKVMLLDVDGVLTDGRIVYDSKGRDLKFFDVHDGLGVYLLKKAGIPTVLITAKSSRTIKPRAKDMRVDAVFADVSPKTSVLGEILAKYKVGKDELCFVGDDLVDLGLMKQVGFGVAVCNACNEIKAAADHTTVKKGGRGAVREIAELVLKTQGKWDELIKAYEN